MYPLTAGQLSTTVEDMGWEVLSHSPSSCTGLSLTNILSLFCFHNLYKKRPKVFCS